MLFYNLLFSFSCLRIIREDHCVERIIFLNVSILADFNLEKIMNKENEIIDLLRQINKKLDGTALLPAHKSNTSCSKCGLKFTDSMGRPITMMYVCGSPDCPCGLGGITC